MGAQEASSIITSMGQAEIKRQFTIWIIKKTGLIAGPWNYLTVKLSELLLEKIIFPFLGDINKELAYIVRVDERKELLIQLLNAPDDQFDSAADDFLRGMNGLKK